MSSDSIWSTIINFIKSLFKNERKKCATDCKCKGCCCDSCEVAVGYNEKGSSSDDSEEDIVITKKKVVIK